MKGKPGTYDADDERAIRAYLRLCEDECELRAEGWIADNTWLIWRDGMRAQLGRWPFDEVWKQAQGESTDFQHLSDVVNDNRADVLDKKLRHRLRSHGV